MKNFPWKELIIYLIATIIFTFLMFALVIKGDAFSYLHFWILVLVVILVIVPLAGKLKISNFLDFNSKIESIRSETQKTQDELHEMRNQFSSFIKTTITPTQNQYTIFEIDKLLPKELIQNLSSPDKNISSSSDASNAKDTKSSFSKTEMFVYGLFMKSFVFLSIAQILKILHYNKRLINPEEMEKGKFINTLPRLIDSLLDSGLSLFIPENKLCDVRNQFLDLKKLVELSNSDGSIKDILSNQTELDKLQNNANDGVASLATGVTYFISRFYLNYHELELGINKILNKLENGTSTNI